MVLLTPIVTVMLMGKWKFGDERSVKLCQFGGGTEEYSGMRITVIRAELAFEGEWGGRTAGIK